MLFHCWSKLSEATSVEAWSKGGWNYMRFLCFLFCIHVDFKYIFWILFYYWKKLGGEHWNKGEWSYVRFLCFLLCFYVFLHFVLVLLLLKIVRWNKCRRLEEVRWNYVKFMYFLFCFHVVFHFDTIILLLNQTRWHKCI
jgi:hypothetical protein